MARIQSPVIGRAKGQAGGMVFTTLNGQNVMKAKAYSYRDQNTLVQQANRAMAATTSRLAASLKGIARSLFVSQPQDMPAYSKLIQQFQAGVDRSSLPYAIEYSGLVIGSGSFDFAAYINVYDTLTGDIGITSDKNTMPDGFVTNGSVELIVVDKPKNHIIYVGPCTGTFEDNEFSALIPSGYDVGDLSICLSGKVYKAGADLQKNVKIFS